MQISYSSQRGSQACVQSTIVALGSGSHGNNGRGCPAFKSWPCGSGLFSLPKRLCPQLPGSASSASSALVRLLATLPERGSGALEERDVAGLGSCGLASVGALRIEFAFQCIPLFERPEHSMQQSGTTRRQRPVRNERGPSYNPRNAGIFSKPLQLASEHGSAEKRCTLLALVSAVDAWSRVLARSLLRCCWPVRRPDALAAITTRSQQSFGATLGIQPSCKGS